MAELPTGTVTFLFTDIEGSTRLWEKHPDAMKAALARHDELLRSAVEAHDGHVVKTTGDGVHAAFADAANAVTAAVEAQRAVGDVEWPLPESLRVRVGLHTGAAEHRDGDYYGPAVNRAARIMDAAHGGQILVSLATEEVLSEALPPGVQLLDLGEHRLRDLARPQRIFQVAAPGLPAEFPAVRSVDAYPGNLPPQLTSFVGRHEELREISEQLAESRLVTLTGVGGVGKTRLAVQVAAEVLPRFPDGAWLCEIAVAEDRESMALIIAAHFGVRARAGLSLDDSIVEFLRTKHLLLILDNCEHLLRPVRALATSVLSTCPGVRILATSREALGVSGEQTWPVRSLDVPEAVAEVASAEAALLFAERARSVRPGFTVDDANAAAVADICNRLDGIPLALELAAARVVAMSPADIATRLDERFRLLTGGRDAAVERHQTLRAAVDWSYSLLDDVERTVFKRLAVFAGTFDAAAAEAVATGDGVEQWDVVDALTALVAKSMVLTEDGPQGVMRYQLLETMRQYAVERLDGDDDVDAWRRRHAAHYAGLAEQITVGLRGRDEDTWRAQLNADLDNLRSAVAWGLDAPEDADGDTALRIISALSYESAMQREVGVGFWAARAIDRAERADPGLRADVLAAAAYSALSHGDHERSRELALAALRDGTVGQSSPSLVHVTRCYVALATGQHDEMRRLLDEARDALADAPEWDRVSFVWTRGSYLALLGENEVATAEVREALEIARRLGSPTAIANCLHALGITLTRSAPAEALAAFGESIDLLRSGNDNLLGSALANVGYLRARKRDRIGAYIALRESVQHLERTGDRPQLAGTVDWTVVVLRRFDELEAAAVLVGAALEGPLAEVNKYPGALGRTPDDRLLVAIEAGLGPERWRAAVARGAAMSVEEVVDFLSRELDRLIAETPESVAGPPDGG